MGFACAALLLGLVSAHASKPPKPWRPIPPKSTRTFGPKTLFNGGKKIVADGEYAPSWYPNSGVKRKIVMPTTSEKEKMVKLERERFNINPSLKRSLAEDAKKLGYLGSTADTWEKSVRSLPAFPSWGEALKRDLNAKAKAKNQLEARRKSEGEKSHGPQEDVAKVHHTE
uniref:MRPL25 domain-containing protein n=1 Tax=Zooxanthella nutricula TaxID=1333877 RepID=A0A7S2IHZ3_9DINO